MGKKLIELMQPDAAAVKKRLFMDGDMETGADVALDLDTELIEAKHLQAIATISEQVNRDFDEDTVAFIQAKELTYTLAGYLYENPIETVLPDTVEKGLSRLRFVAGW